MRSAVCGRHSSRCPRRTRRRYGGASIYVRSSIAISYNGTSRWRAHTPDSRSSIAATTSQRSTFRISTALADRRGRPAILPLHVRRCEVSMRGNALWPPLGTPHCDQVYAACNPALASARHPLCRVHRRHHFDGAQQGRVDSPHVDRGRSATLPRLRCPTRQDRGSPNPLARVFRLAGEHCLHEVPGPTRGDPRSLPLDLIDSVAHEGGQLTLLLFFSFLIGKFSSVRGAMAAALMHI